MEAAPRLIMLYCDVKTSPEIPQFSAKLKPYIAKFYNEDPETYNGEIQKLEKLRAAAAYPSLDVAGVQTLKQYYCQLHFLMSRFPMEEKQVCAVQFVWKDAQGNVGSCADIRFELAAVLCNIGAIHSYLGATDSRSTSEGLKMACTHFQCGAWAFQTLKEKYSQFLCYITSMEMVHFEQQVCLAQAQECILAKSMLDNRKPTIIAKVAVQVYDFYRQSQVAHQSTTDEFCGSKLHKERGKYLQFKIAYHRCIALLFQGQQAEEQQKMGERVAFYQGASEHLEEARKFGSNLSNKEVLEALSFTSDVVEGKKKAAKNENEFIYHEEVPDLSHLQEVKGASLVKGTPFNVNDPDVSGPDIFARLVPMEAHEAASLYSEKKAQLLRQTGEIVETKDQQLAEFMSSMQLDILSKIHQASGVPQDIIDRAAALSVRTAAIPDLIEAMNTLSNIYQEVEASLNEIDALLKEEEESEKSYQEIMGKRPLSIIATDLAREAAKYREAHNKANESNQTLHKAMLMHVANLKILQQPLRQLQLQLPAIELPNPNIDDDVLKELDKLSTKVDEMRTQRAMLWAQLRDAVHNDDITSALVTKPPNQSLDELFLKEIEKHENIISIIKQNISAQDNIQKAFVDVYARALNTRRYIQDMLQKRSSTIQALVTSYDAYEDLLTKANKGIEFYTKLETNVSKLLQRLRSACKVQQEEREQMLSTSNLGTKKVEETEVSISNNSHVVAPAAPKLKDFLDARKKGAAAVKFTDPAMQYPAVNYGSVTDTQQWPPGIRPAPLGSEVTSIPKKTDDTYYNYQYTNYSNQLPAYPTNYYASTTQSYQAPQSSTISLPTITPQQSYVAAEQPQQMHGSMTQLPNSYPQQTYLAPQDQYPMQPGPQQHQVDELTKRMNPLITPTSQYSSYIPQNYSSTPYSYSNMSPQTYNQTETTPDSSKAFTTTTNSFQPISSFSTGSTSHSYPESNPPPPPPQGNIQSTTASYSIPQVNYPMDNSYYPQGYAPNYSPLTAESYSTPQKYHNQEYATSVTPDLSNYSYSTYTSPLSQTSYTPNDYYNQTPTYYNANTSQTYYQTPQVPVAPQPQLQQPEVAKPTSSNIDLLSGLDFSITQAPLVPQQSKTPSESSVATSHSSNNVSNKVAAKIVEPINQTAAATKVENKLSKVFASKSMENTEVRSLFAQEIDKYDKFVETLTNKTLSGPTNLELKWKEVQEKQEQDSGNRKMISVARCYPAKNRFPDILPYDYSRVELREAADDYINASYVQDSSKFSPHFIVTQAPLASTFADFWSMIKEQQIELIFCLLNDTEIGDDVYWPIEKGRNLQIKNNMVLSLQSIIVKPDWTERLISISIPEKRETFVVMHLQFTSWPGSLFPTSPEPFINYTLELINLFEQQRNLSHPVAVHCAAGIGRSGLLVLLATAILEATNNSNSIPDLTLMTTTLTNCHKNILRDREHLKFAYECFLSYMRKVVSQDKHKRKLNDLVPMAKQEEPKVQQQIEVKEERNVDPLSSLDPFWASKKLGN